jgi:hypothetical protein
MTLKMSHEDVKIAAINGGSMLLSFTNIEATLKIVLLVFSIVYTAYKIYEIHESRKSRRNGEQN